MDVYPPAVAIAMEEGLAERCVVTCLLPTSSPPPSLSPSLFLQHTLPYSPPLLLPPPTGWCPSMRRPFLLSRSSGRHSNMTWESEATLLSIPPSSSSTPSLSPLPPLSPLPLNHLSLSLLLTCSLSLLVARPSCQKARLRQAKCDLVWLVHTMIRDTFAARGAGPEGVGRFIDIVTNILSENA